MVFRYLFPPIVLEILIVTFHNFLLLFLLDHHDPKIITILSVKDVMQLITLLRVQWFIKFLKTNLMIKSTISAFEVHAPSDLSQLSEVRRHTVPNVLASLYRNYWTVVFQIPYLESLRINFYNAPWKNIKYWQTYEHLQLRKLPKLIMRKFIQN